MYTNTEKDGLYRVELVLSLDVGLDEEDVVDRLFDGEGQLPGLNRLETRCPYSHFI